MGMGEIILIRPGNLHWVSLKQVHVEGYDESEHELKSVLIVLHVRRFGLLGEPASYRPSTMRK